MRKGLPSVRAGDGRMPSGGDKGEEEFAIDDDEEVEAQEKMDEDEAADEMGKGVPNQNVTPSGQPIPALDEEQEYEWKWKVGFHGSVLTSSRRWMCLVEPSSCRSAVRRSRFFLLQSSLHPLHPSTVQTSMHSTFPHYHPEVVSSNNYRSR